MTCDAFAEHEDEKGARMAARLEELREAEWREWQAGMRFDAAADKTEAF